MKNRLKIILFLIIFPVLIFGKDTAVVGSFNTLHLGWKGKDYNKTAQIISMFDIVALQEVMSEERIKELKDVTEKISNEKWEYIISEKSVGNDKYREFYGF